MTDKMNFPAMFNCPKCGKKIWLNENERTASSIVCSKCEVRS